jgi:FkbH-like protein
MYETESNRRVESADQIPADVLSAFKDRRGTVMARTVLPWSEHCTECVWPTCYSTCDLYSPREDGRCRRFADGMVRVECPEALNSYLLKIRFKRWGKLWTPANIRLHAMDKALKLEERDHRIGSTLYQISLPGSLKRTLVNKRYSYKKRVAGRAKNTDRLPTSFLLECYNPENRNVRLSLTMRSVDAAVMIPFQELFDLTPGFHRIRVGIEGITRHLDVRHPFTVELIPNDDDDERETTLYFGLMDFVEELAEPTEKPKKLKCIVWDLDNTLWDGVLVEDGASKLRLKPDVVDIIKTLDGRGILHSIASKNDRKEALQVLKQFQIDQYFLCPQISWQPKSEGVKAIAEQLNIGRDTLLFVDDTDFELEQVKSMCPDVRVLDARECRTLLEMKEFQVPATEESRNRRQMYQVDTQRQDLAAKFGDDYLAFLRDCNIRLNIRPLTEQNLQRVHELTQRTNQMNFSGNRYERDILSAIIDDPFLDTYVLDCEDRFGSYGVVGFSIVDSREPRMTDLMFSCRIQSKRVEHAFLAYVIRKYLTESGRDFYANYRKTSRNAPSGKVFDDFGMETITVKDGVASLVFVKGREVPEDGIVHIVVHEQRSPSFAR